MALSPNPLTRAKRDGVNSEPIIARIVRIRVTTRRTKLLHFYTDNIGTHSKQEATTMSHLRVI